MIRLGDLRFTALLPPTLAEDPSFSAAGSAVGQLAQRLANVTPRLLLWHRLALTAGRATPEMLSPIQRVTGAAGGLAPLSEAELELLAWQFHVDFREVARTPEQLAEMVRQSIPWHRIKGTPASIRAALALFGIGADIEEDGKGDNWAVYQMLLRGVDTVERARLAYRVALEMQPVRCRLRRVYNEHLDARYIIWTARGTWSTYYWSFNSGVRDPETGVIVSFGRRGAALAALELEPEVSVGTTLSHGLLIRYIRSWIWSYSRWSDLYPPSSGFVHGQLDTRPVEREDRPWLFRGRRVAREQLVWSGADMAVPVGQWGDINCRWSKGTFLLFRSPRWGASRWSCSNGRRLVTTLERRLAPGRALVPYAGQPVCLPGTVRAHSVRINLYPNNIWLGAWDSRFWNPAPPVPHASTSTRLPSLRWSSPACGWGKAVW